MKRTRLFEMVMRARYIGIYRGAPHSLATRRPLHPREQNTLGYCSSPLSRHLTMWRCSCVAVLLPALLLLWGGGADAAPLFGLLSLLSTNGTSLLSTLLLNHVQDKINKLEILADLIAIAANSTGS